MASMLLSTGHLFLEFGPNRALVPEQCGRTVRARSKPKLGEQEWTCIVIKIGDKNELHLNILYAIYFLRFSHRSR